MTDRAGEVADQTQFDLEIDDNLNGTLVVVCGQCGRKLKKKLNDLGTGKEIPCTCGAVFHIGDNKLRDVQRSFDNFRNKLRGLGK